MAWFRRKRNKGDKNGNNDISREEHLSRQQAKWDNLFLNFERDNMKRSLAEVEGKEMPEEFLEIVTKFWKKAIENGEKLKQKLCEHYADVSAEYYKKGVKENPIKDEIFKFMVIESFKKYILHEMYELLLKTRDYKLGKILSKAYASLSGSMEDHMVAMQENPGNFGRRIWLGVSVPCEYLAEYNPILGDVEQIIKTFIRSDEIVGFYEYIDGILYKKARELGIPEKEFATFAKGFE